MLTQDKVRGCFLGAAVGDALGMPVETFSIERIKEIYGRITELHEPKDHKWFDGEPAGMLTDDTQLTLAVARGMVLSPGDPLNMDTQAVTHVAALKESTKGWGRSTKESIRRLANGVHWSKSGQSDGEWTGRGNGVPMKIAPVGLYLATVIDDDTKVDEVCNFVAKLSMMTHQTSISASAALAQMMAVYCCVATEGKLNIPKFCQLVVKASGLGKDIAPETIGEDDLTDRLYALINHDKYDTDKIVEEFGAGSCYCYNSIPFTLMHFVKNPDTIDSLYDVVSAGGDTDSNGSMLGACLGALHGESIFPEHLVDGVQGKAQVMEIADQFWELVKPGN